MVRTLLATIVIVGLMAGMVQAEDDFQYWSQYMTKMVDTEKVDVSLYGEVRFTNDIDDVGLYLISPKVSYDLWDNLSLGTNYTYIQTKVNNKTAGRSEHKFQHRLEFEVNPHFKITDWMKFNMRNRMEFRWIEDNGTHNSRSRHLLGFSVPVKKENCPLTAFYFNSEFFYDYAKHEYNENRSIPLGLSFKLSNKTKLNVFYMIQTRKGTSDWSANQILGTTLGMQF